MPAYPNAPTIDSHSFAGEHFSCAMTRKGGSESKLDESVFISSHDIKIWILIPSNFVAFGKCLNQAARCSHSSDGVGPTRSSRPLLVALLELNRKLNTDRLYNVHREMCSKPEYWPVCNQSSSPSYGDHTDTVVDSVGESGESFVREILLEILLEILIEILLEKFH